MYNKFEAIIRKIEILISIFVKLIIIVSTLTL